MTEVGKDYKAIYPFFILFILLAPFVILFDRGDAVLLLNGRHEATLDVFFKKVTFLGEGIVIAMAGVLTLLGNRRLFLVFLMGLLLHFFFIHINKHLLFADLYRPLGYFEQLKQGDLIYKVPGIDVHKRDTFPSGHTTGATFGLSMLAFLWIKQRYAIGLALVALLVGLSRVYLAQHFLIDITFGILFGSLSTFLGGLIIDKWVNTGWASKKIIPFEL